MFKLVTNTQDRIIINIFSIRIKISKHKPSSKQLKNRNSLYEIEDSSIIIPSVLSKEETLEELLNSNKSICRYGDGEFNIIDGSDIGFQNSDSELAKRLKEILIYNRQDIIVGIPNIFGSLKKYDKKAKQFWRKFLFYNREKIYKCLDMDKQYYDSFISRPYFIFEDKNCDDYFNSLKKLWDKKDIIIVEGKFSRLGYKNNLFSNVSSIKRILCPEKNAWNSYDKILEMCKSISKDKLFIIALGPTATVLAYDLSSLGYRALDLGHIDIEYEWFLRKSKTKIAIPNKYVNESPKGKNISSKVGEEFLAEVLYDLSNEDC